MCKIVGNLNFFRTNLVETLKFQSLSREKSSASDKPIEQYIMTTFIANKIVLTLLRFCHLSVTGVLGVDLNSS